MESKYELHVKCINSNCDIFDKNFIIKPKLISNNFIQVPYLMCDNCGDIVLINRNKNE